MGKSNAIKISRWIHDGRGVQNPTKIFKKWLYLLESFSILFSFNREVGSLASRQWKKVRIEEYPYMGGEKYYCLSSNILRTLHTLNIYSLADVKAQTPREGVQRGWKLINDLGLRGEEDIE